MRTGTVSWSAGRFTSVADEKTFCVHSRGTKRSFQKHATPVGIAVGISFETYCERLGNPDFISADELAEIILFCWKQPQRICVRDIVVTRQDDATCMANSENSKANSRNQ